MRYALHARVLALLSLAALLAACKHDVPAPGIETVAQTGQSAFDNAGASYKARLLAAIAGADRIVVNEHSYRFDGVDMNSEGGNVPQPRPVVLYAEATMTAKQKTRFASAIAAMPAAASGAMPMCIFEGRHTIQFYVGGKLASALDICFHCGQLSWKEGDQDIYPDALVRTLKTVIEDVGLRSERDWNQYAIDHGKKSL